MLDLLLKCIEEDIICGNIVFVIKYAVIMSADMVNKCVRKDNRKKNTKDNQGVDTDQKEL